MLSKLFSDKKRWLSVLVILALLIPAFILTKYAYEPGRIIGLIIYVSIGMLGLYEVFKSVGINKYLSMILPLSILSFVFLDWNVFEDFIIYGSSARGSSMSQMIYSAFAGGDKIYIKYLIVLVISFVPLFDDNFRRSSGIVIRQFIVTVVTFITFIFVKMIWVMNMNDFGKMAFFISIAIIADTFAYIGGMFFGKKWFKGAKFSPKLSPKKTWAGFVVGVSLAATFAILVGYFAGIWEDFGSHEILVSVLAGLFLAVIAPYGDLAFSAIKRFVGVKDFSNLIPGHGGVYDRVDAMAIIVVFGSIIYLLA